MSPILVLLCPSTLTNYDGIRHRQQKNNKRVNNIIKRKTYEPSSHSGLRKLPPPLTPGIQDFFGGRAATTNDFREPTAPLLPTLVEPNRALGVFFPPFRNGEPNPLSTAVDVAAMCSALLPDETECEEYLKKG